MVKKKISVCEARVDRRKLKHVYVSKYLEFLLNESGRELEKNVKGAFRSLVNGKCLCYECVRGACMRGIVWK